MPSGNLSYQPTHKEEAVMLGAMTAITQTHALASPQEVKDLLSVSFPYLTPEALEYWCDWFGISVQNLRLAKSSQSEPEAHEYQDE